METIKSFTSIEQSKVLGGCLSTTLDWLEHDLLCKVPFDKDKDTYTKNWKTCG